MGSESKTIVRILCQIEQHKTVRPSPSVVLFLVQSVPALGEHLYCLVSKMIPVTDVLITTRYLEFDDVYMLKSPCFNSLLVMTITLMFL
jgi:hypothetical protein